MEVAVDKAAKMIGTFSGADGESFKDWSETVMTVMAMVEGAGVTCPGFQLIDSPSCERTLPTVQGRPHPN